MERREYSWLRNSITIAAIVPIAQPKIRWIIGCAAVSASCRNPKRLRCEKIDAIERGDNFTTNKQFLQVIAVAELFVAKDAEPKIRGRDLGLI